MPTHGVTYEILIASPSDVVAERDIVSECARDWNSAHSRSGVQVRAVRWELDAVPAMSDRAQAIINEQLVDQADILIGIFKARIGSPTGISASGTIEEIDRFIAAGKPVMLYFSTGPIPHDHDANQLQLLRAYKSQIASRGVYAEFADDGELRRKVNHNIAAMMARLTGEQPAASPRQPDLARVFIRTRPGQRSGDVNTVRVSAVIENISPVRRIDDYCCTISIPRGCLTHTSARYVGEITKDHQGTHRKFRFCNDNPGFPSKIYSGDEQSFGMFDIAVDQLNMKNTYLAGDYEGTMGAKIEVDAVIEGDGFHAERTVADIFANPVHG